MRRYAKHDAQAEKKCHKLCAALLRQAKRLKIDDRRFDRLRRDIRKNVRKSRVQGRKHAALRPGEPHGRRRVRRQDLRAHALRIKERQAEPHGYVERPEQPHDRRDDPKAPELLAQRLLISSAVIDGTHKEHKHPGDDRCRRIRRKQPEAQIYRGTRQDAHPSRPVPGQRAVHRKRREHEAHAASVHRRREVVKGREEHHEDDPHDKLPSAHAELLQNADHAAFPDHDVDHAHGLHTAQRDARGPVQQAVQDLHDQ